MVKDRAYPAGRRAIAALLCVLVIALTAAAMWASYRWAERRALAELEERGQSSLVLYREMLRGWLGRFRSLAPVYARDQLVIGLLRNPDDPDRTARLNARLVLWNSESGAADTYVLDGTGLTLAASNWDQPVSFVGRRYDFRPYFRDAMQGRLGRYFALGTSSRRRGYYFAFPVREAGETLGVVVVKVAVEQIEDDLSQRPDEVFVSDAAGVIVLAGRPGWRLRTLGPLTEQARATIRADRQFDLDALTAAPVTGDDVTASGGLVRARLDGPEAAAEAYLHVSLPMTVEGWRVHLLLPTRAAHVQALTAAMLTGTVLVALALAGLALWQRRRRYLERLAERERVQHVLERAVAERTADLSASNQQLATEAAERAEAERELRKAQAELIQAGKLAALGQMSAALSHEFNQPLAAIRAYAENAVAFMERGRNDRAGENLGRIARLTERMAQLSKHLTTFSRRQRDTVEAVALAPVLDETLELLHGRIERAGVALEVEPAAGMVVLGGHTRLQHVFMNLVGNAIDATAAVPKPEISIGIAAGAEQVTITVDDNGPGIAPEVIDTLFDPFVTTKQQGRGLGLGLSISYNILRDFSGSIEAGNRNGRGARFVVRLRRASSASEAAE